MEEVKTFQVTGDNGYIRSARDNGHYQKEKSDIADAFHKLEVSIDLGSFYMDTANILRSLIKNYVGLSDILLYTLFFLDSLLLSFILIYHK